MEITKEEQNAINTLDRLAKRWPKTLWLFATGMSLHVMKCDKDGGHATLPCDGMDPDYSITTIDIENDGGDW